MDREDDYHQQGRIRNMKRLSPERDDIFKIP